MVPLQVAYNACISFVSSFYQPLNLDPPDRPSPKDPKLKIFHILSPQSPKPQISYLVTGAKPVVAGQDPEGYRLKWNF